MKTTADFIRDELVKDGFGELDGIAVFAVKGDMVNVKVISEGISNRLALVHTMKECLKERLSTESKLDDLLVEMGVTKSVNMPRPTHAPEGGEDKTEDFIRDVMKAAEEMLKNDV